MDFLKLENQICFPVYVLSRHITNHYRPILDKLDLTYPQYLVLLYLWEHKTTTVKDLGNALFLDSGTLTPLLKRMEQKGLLKRQRHKSDERLVEIFISEQGMQLQQAAADVPMQLLCSLQVPENELADIKMQIQALTRLLIADYQPQQP